jgi:hypothetical protein
MISTQLILRISFWGSIILIPIGIAGALLNIVIFLGIKTCRHSPMAVYIVSQAIADICTLSMILIRTASLLALSASSISCKLLVYSGELTICMSMNFLCLAAVDRWACTSQSTVIRRFSSITISRRLSAFCYFFWSLVHIPYLVYLDLVPPAYRCAFTNELFAYFSTYFFASIFTILLPLLTLVVFSLLTYRNIVRVTSVRQQMGEHRLSTWEHQMTRVMLTQIILCITCALPRGLFVVYSMATSPRSLDSTNITAPFTAVFDRKTDNFRPFTIETDPVFAPY